MKRKTEPTDDTNLTISARSTKTDPLSLASLWTTTDNGPLEQGGLSTSWFVDTTATSPDSTPAADYFPGAQVVSKLVSASRNYLLLSQNSSSTLKPNLIYSYSPERRTCVSGRNLVKLLQSVRAQTDFRSHSLSLNNRSFICLAMVVNARFSCSLLQSS